MSAKPPCVTNVWPTIARELAAVTRGLYAPGDAAATCEAFVRDALKRFPLTAAMTMTRGGCQVAVLYTPHADALREAFSDCVLPFAVDVRGV